MSWCDAIWWETKEGEIRTSIWVHKYVMLKPWKWPAACLVPMVHWVKHQNAVEQKSYNQDGLHGCSCTLHMCYLSSQVHHSKRTSVPATEWVPMTSSCRAGSFGATLEIPHSALSVLSLVHLSWEQSPDSGTYLVEDTPDLLPYRTEVSVQKYFREKKPKQTTATRT